MYNVNVKQVYFIYFAVLKLEPDVAGATLMAAGSSAPELFTSVLGILSSSFVIIYFVFGFATHV